MSRAVPFLKREYIESEAEELLASYGAKYRLLIEPPIPVDEILNVHLRVALDFDDLTGLLGVASDVFGATWIEREQVIIDQSLDPTNHPERIGRYNFTVAHETGHWQLHRHLFVKDIDQQVLFEDRQAPTVVCRTSEAREPIEWQADFFAACLLMPKAMTFRYWQARYSVPRLLVTELRSRSQFDGATAEDALIENFVKPLAMQFAVSPTAMRIRLETLGLVVPEDLPTLFVT